MMVFCLLLGPSLASQVLFFNSSTQTASFTRLSFPLSISGFPYMLVTLDTQPPANIALGVLLLADSDLQPSIQIQSDGRLDISATYSDILSFALRKNHNVLQLNTTNLVRGDYIYVSIYTPQVSFSGLPYQLTGILHCNY